jgi:hypothetical protein
VEGGGIAMFYHWGAQLFNNLVVGNQSDIAGGIYILASPLCNIINCTIASNQANLLGGGVCTYQYSYPRIRNSIVFQDTAALSPNLFSSADDSIVVSYSDIEGGWAGIEVINEPPQFVSGVDGDYYLSQIASGQASESPAVDRGDSLAINYLLDTMTTRTDQIGDHGFVDLGFHYYRHPSSRIITANHEPQIPNSIHLSAFPNPFNASISIQFTTPSSYPVQLVVYDVLGRKIAMIGQYAFSAGNHTLHWRGISDQGQPVASGMYFARLTTPLGAKSIPIVNLK